MATHGYPEFSVERTRDCCSKSVREEPRRMAWPNCLEDPSALQTICEIWTGLLIGALPNASATPMSRLASDVGHGVENGRSRESLRDREREVWRALVTALFVSSQA